MRVIVLGVEIGGSGIEKISNIEMILRQQFYHLLKPLQIFYIHAAPRGPAKKKHHTPKVDKVLIKIPIWSHVFFGVFENIFHSLLFCGVGGLIGGKLHFYKQLHRLSLPVFRQLLREVKKPAKTVGVAHFQHRKLPDDVGHYDMVFRAHR